MDQSAIQRIECLALAAATHGTLANCNVALLPDGFKIESLEKYGDTPDRHRETFKTKYLSEFFGYAEKQDETPAVFVDEHNMWATAIFDRSTPANPTWHEHKAIIKLEETPALLALLQSNDKQLTQAELIDFAIDWREHIVFFEGETELNFNDALSRLRKLKISKSSSVESNRGDFKASANAIEQIAIDAADAPLPTHFEFSTEPYLQFDERIYTGQLRALGDDNKPILKYRLMGLPVIEQSIAEEFKDRIKDKLTSAIVHIGTI